MGKTETEPTIKLEQLRHVVSRAGINITISIAEAPVDFTLGELLN